MGIETKTPEKCYILINLVDKLLNMSHKVGKWQNMQWAPSYWFSLITVFASLQVCISCNIM